MLSRVLYLSIWNFDSLIYTLLNIVVVNYSNCAMLLLGGFGMS